MRADLPRAWFQSHVSRSVSAGFAPCHGIIALSGPSVLALASLFVLRRTDGTQTRAASQAHAAATQAATAPPPP